MELVKEARLLEGADHLGVAATKTLADTVGTTCLAAGTMRTPRIEAWFLLYVRTDDLPLPLQRKRGRRKLFDPGGWSWMLLCGRRRH